MKQRLSNPRLIVLWFYDSISARPSVTPYLVTFRKSHSAMGLISNYFSDVFSLPRVETRMTNYFETCFAASCVFLACNGYFSLNAGKKWTTRTFTAPT